jgi:hypothetical protein
MNMMHKKAERIYPFAILSPYFSDLPTGHDGCEFTKKFSVDGGEPDENIF